MLRRSSSSSNHGAATPPGTNWQSTRDYGASLHTPNANESNYGQIVSSSQSFRAIPDSRDFVDSVRSFGRTTTSFSAARSAPAYDQPFYRAPSQHRAPVQVMILDRAAPPTSPEQWRSHLRHTRPVPSGALESLTKEFYTPNSKRLIKSVNLYYRDTPVKPHELDGDDDGKRCSVCLEDFERGHEVMLTPCKHMFHEACIVPWVTSNAHCPVCRFALDAKATDRTPGLGFNGGRSGNGARNRVLTNQEFLSILRALGPDGYEWG